MYISKRYFTKLIIIILFALPLSSQAARKTTRKPVKKDTCEEALADKEQKPPATKRTRATKKPPAKKEVPATQETQAIEETAQEANEKTPETQATEEAQVAEETQKPEETTHESTNKMPMLPSDQILSFYSTGIFDYNNNVPKEKKIKSMSDVENNKDNPLLLQKVEEISSGVIKSIPSKKELIELLQDSKKRLANGERLVLNIDQYTSIVAVLLGKI